MVSSGSLFRGPLYPPPPSTLPVVQNEEENTAEVAQVHKSDVNLVNTDKATVSNEGNRKSENGKLYHNHHQP